MVGDSSLQDSMKAAEDSLNDRQKALAKRMACCNRQTTRECNKAEERGPEVAREVLEGRSCCKPSTANWHPISRWTFVSKMRKKTAC
eukprot:2776879-Amphidinium_carterae.1